jgi:hypothetical protein
MENDEKNLKPVDPRVSGPLDRRLMSFDHEVHSTPSEGRFTERIEQSDRTRFCELIERFAAQIELPELQIDDQNSCSISIGEGNEAVNLTVELRIVGEIILFTSLESHPEGVSPELAARIDLINSTQQDENYYLATSKHSVFLCASRSITEAKDELFADWILDFYRHALEWRERYRRNSNVNNLLSPSTGLKV